MTPTPPPLEFDGLDDAEEALADAAAAGTAAYLRVLRVDSPRAMPTVGRREWNKIDMAPYMVEDDGADADVTATRGLFDEPEEPSEEDAAKKPDDHRAMAAAMCRWVKDAVRGQLGPGDGVVVFKLDLRSPKGDTCLAAPRIRVRRIVVTPPAGTPGGANIDPTLPLEPMPPAVARPTDPEARAWLALNDAFQSILSTFQRSQALMQAGYTHQTRLTLGALGDVRDVHAITTRTLVTQLQSQAKQIVEKDKLLVQLADEMIGFRIDLAGIGLNASGQRENTEQKAAMMKGAIEQAGKLGELYLAGKLELEPELVGLLMIIRKDAKLLACLKDPRVQLALQNDELRNGIVETLLAVAASMPDPSTSTPSEPTP